MKKKVKKAKKISKKKIVKHNKKAVKKKIIHRHVKKTPKKIPKKHIVKHKKKPQEKIVETIKEDLRTIPAEFFMKKVEQAVAPEQKIDYKKYEEEYAKQFKGKSLKTYYENLFYKSWGVVKARTLTFKKTIGMDLLSLLILIILLRGALRFVPDPSTQLYYMFGLPFMVSVSILFFLLGVLLYSFIKYRTLFVIESLLEDAKFNLDRFDKFYILNILSFGTWFVALFIAYISTQFVSPAWKTMVWILFAIVSASIYSFISISHWVYAHEAKIRKAIRKTFAIMRVGFEKYIGITDLLFTTLALYVFVIAVIGWLLKIIGIDLWLYQRVVALIGVIIFYVVIAYNRICFYFFVEELRHAVRD
jgi:hypothetical protein